MGFAAGFAVGYWVGATPANERRAKLDQMWAGIRDNPRVQRVTDTVARDAHRVGDAVEQRLVDRADGATDAIAGSDAPTSGGSGSTGSGSSEKQSA